MGQNSKLNKAQCVKNDEFYTLYDDLEKIVKCFKKELFTDKIVYCPFDGENSNFVKYFKDHKDDLNYKELIYTWDDYKNHHDLFLKADIIISNPPFSLFLKEIFPYLNNLSQEKVKIMVGLNITAAKTIIMVNNIWKCNMLYLEKFNTPKNVIKRIASTVIFTGVPEEYYIQPPRFKYEHEYTMQELKDQNLIEIIYDVKTNEKYLSILGLKYMPIDYVGWVAVPVTSTICLRKVRQKPEYLDKIELYGNLIQTKNKDGKKCFLKTLIRWKKQ